MRCERVSICVKLVGWDDMVNSHFNIYLHSYNCYNKISIYVLLRLRVPEEEASMDRGRDEGEGRRVEQRRKI